MLNDSEDIDEHLQANVFGSIYRRVMEELYDPFVNHEVSTEQIETMVQNTLHTDQLITKAFNDIYFKTDTIEPLTGYNLLVGGIIKKYEGFATEHIYNT